MIAAIFDRYTITGEQSLPVTENDIVESGCEVGLTVELLSQPSTGTAVVDNLNVIFTPNDERLCNTGSFTYRLNSPCGLSNIALVNVTHIPATVIWANDDTTITLADGTCLVDN